MPCGPLLLSPLRWAQQAYAACHTDCPPDRWVSGRSSFLPLACCSGGFELLRMQVARDERLGAQQADHPIFNRKQALYVGLG